MFVLLQKFLDMGVSLPPGTRGRQNSTVALTGPREQDDEGEFSFPAPTGWNASGSPSHQPLAPTKARGRGPPPSLSLPADFHQEYGGSRRHSNGIFKLLQEK